MAADTYHLHRQWPEQPRIPGMGLVVWLYEQFIFPGGPLDDAPDWAYVNEKLHEARILGVPAVLDIEARRPDEHLSKLVRMIVARRNQLFPGVPIWIYPLSHPGDPNAHWLLANYPELYAEWFEGRRRIGQLFGELIDGFVPHFYLEHDWDENRVYAHGSVFLPALVKTMPSRVKVRPALWHWTNYPHMRGVKVGEARAARWCAHVFAAGAVLWNYDWRTFAEFSRDPAARIYMGMPVNGADLSGPAPLVPAFATTAHLLRGHASLPAEDLEAWAAKVREAA